jgi:hypothetical protein
MLIGTPQSRRNTRGKGDYFISDSKSYAKSKVTLRRGHEEYTKSYDGKNRKTLCELNGMKITMKAVVGNLRDDVRFWSSESLSLLDSGPEGFVNYVDKNLCDRGNSLLLKADSAYNDWVKSHENLSELKLLQIRKEGNDEMESFSEYLTDVSLFESKLQKVLSEAFHILNEINDALYDGTTSAEESRTGHDTSSTSSTTSTSTSTKSTSDAASIDELLKKIKYCLRDSSPSSSSSSSSSSSCSSTLHHGDGVEHPASDTQSSSSDRSNSSTVTEQEHEHEDESPAMTAWSVALSTTDFLSNLSDALDNTLYSSDKPASNTNTNTNSGNNNKVRNKELAGGKESDFNTIINIIEEQGNKIILLEKEFEKLNLKRTNFDMKMESLHNCFQIIEDNVMKVKKEILDMRNSVPVMKINDIIGKFQALMTESEKLCRRHDVRTYAELQVEKEKWQNDLILMENLIFTLPESEKHELKLRREYTEIALDLTEMRLSGAHQFISRVNDMLPDLEMGDKSIGVNFLLLAGRDSSTFNGNGNGIINSKGMALRREEGLLQKEGDNEEEEDGDLERAFCNWKDSFFDISDADRKMEESNNMSMAELERENNNVTGDAVGVAVGVQDVDSYGDDTAHDRHMRAKERHEELKSELVSKIAGNLCPSVGANGRGWDDIALSVRTCRKRNTRKEGEVEAEVGQVSVPVPVMSPMSSLIQVYLKSSQSINLDGDSVDVRMSSEVSVLSSGESTRLALAMETCTHTAPALITAELSSPLQSEGPGHFFGPQERGAENAVNSLPKCGTEEETYLVHGNEVRSSVEVDRGRGGGETLAVTVSHPVPVMDGIQVPSGPRSLPVQVRGHQGEGKGRGNGRSFEGLLILDEIDAHIGGQTCSSLLRLTTCPSADLYLHCTAFFFLFRTILPCHLILLPFPSLPSMPPPFPSSIP